ncbi:MAG: tRNA pseudouridine(55) synthase TruB [Telluria sp.]|nr:tRNA pseudouridine(55) synthase TruB [Telluria sp.]
MSQFRRRRRVVNGVLLLDKPHGLSSNEAMLVVRGIYQADKAGHTGTLDPLATGLLPVCLGQATKLTSYLLDARKRYIAEVRLGARTSTGDIEGEVVETSDPSGLDEATLRSALPAFTGRIQQVPPMYSALKRDGTRLYELARAGVEIEREPRQVEIHALDLLSFDGQTAVLDVRCSKGTYIRTLAEDWARSLGQAAHLQGLRRIEVGPFQPLTMVTLETLKRTVGEGAQALDALLLPSRAALAGWVFLRVDQVQIGLLSRGLPVPLAIKASGSVAIEDEQSRLLGLGEIDAAGRLQPRRWFGAI